MKERLQELFAKHLSRQLNARERTELMGLLLEPALQDEVMLLLQPVWENSGGEHEFPEAKKELFFQNLFESAEDAPVVPIRRKGRLRWIAAASVLLVLMAALYFTLFNRQQPPIEIVQTKIDVPAPNSTNAHIQLADGSIVLLDSLTALQQGSVAITKDKNGHVVYNGEATEQRYNTLVNPRGSKVVNIELADGTRIWLNSASSVKYFTSNSGTSRDVEVTGEAYFEVAKNPKQPFIVKKGNTNITVLGTHFNVNAYDDESDMKVTLLEGSVKVENVLLKPSEQIAVKNSGDASSRLSKPTTVQTDAVVAWKNGWFSFRDANVKTVMRQLSRWYDIEVDYSGTMPAKTFTGDIGRSLTLTQVLKGIAGTTGIKYTFINNRKILIQP
ncbi:DUF4974 domain-containing protein [Pseudoflavitalea sp. G-6-1-2]|uniref:FecR family protein n=1 Tax=Pseudoflavitalea sp. G-6-1-2 TaxID=2728841 RepID=UPI00146CC9B5|nr:FecR family protein [Pseudoflavitalea sp. G-6-1-2]NML22562.1 DUF4974 domain-containing protein [Pseudoflavitalea sp. G-6-1-2]